MQPLEIHKKQDVEAYPYLRVSSKKQVDDGNGLDGQERRTREYCTFKGYSIGGVFIDAGVSGGKTERDGMKDLLERIKKRRKELPPTTRLVVVIDDVSRLARDIRAHLDLKDAIIAAGAELESPGIEFGTDSNSILFEQTQAVFAEHQRRSNTERVCSRMRARVQSGYYCFTPIYGFEYVDAPGGGRMLAPKEPEASVVREVYEGMACGRFRSATEVARFLDNFPSVPKNKYGEVRLQRAIDMLKNPLYAGYITVAKWNIYLQPAQHEALVDFALWQKAQDCLADKSKTAARKTENQDFVMRGFVSCPSCNRAMTAGWSRSRTGKRYPYYQCQTRKCERRGKSVNRAELEGEFETLLKSLTPAPQSFAAFRAMCSDFWDTQTQRVQETKQQARLELERVRQKTSKLINRIVATEDQRIITAYEDEIRQLDQRKVLLEEKLNIKEGDTETFEKLYRTACAFLSNPQKIWASGDYNIRKTVLRLLIPTPIQYAKNEGYRTSGFAQPLRLLQTLSAKGYGVVGPVGLEPTTRRL